MRSRRIYCWERIFALISLPCSLMKLFEGGILDKITNDEYEKMFQSMPADAENIEKISSEQEEKVDMKLNGRRSTNTKSKTASEKELTALNLRTLQGAFYLVLMGHILALIALILEIESRKAPRKFVKRLRMALSSSCYAASARILRAFKRI